MSLLTCNSFCFSYWASFQFYEYMHKPSSSPFFFFFFFQPVKLHSQITLYDEQLGQMPSGTVNFIANRQCFSVCHVLVLTEQEKITEDQRTSYLSWMSVFECPSPTLQHPPWLFRKLTWRPDASSRNLKMPSAISYSSLAPQNMNPMLKLQVS